MPLAHGFHPVLKKAMDDKLVPGNLPEQQQGASTHTQHEIECGSREEAEQVYELAKNRLLSVNAWHEYAGAGSAEFSLFNEAGQKKEGPVVKGDRFQIDIPGPGSSQGEGFDWVQVEDVEEHKAESTAHISIRVRPTRHPEHRDEGETAHFFTHDATSNFVVSRNGLVVKAEVFGRNEIPNIAEAEGLLDKARNAAVGATAAAGISKIQWKNLVKGLIEYRNDSGN